MTTTPQTPTRRAARDRRSAKPARGRSGRWRVAAAGGFAVLVAGCSAPAATAGGGPPAGGGALAGVQVPDAYTAVTVRPLSAPTFPFPGTDGRYHIVYDLELTNAGPVPATIDKLDVVDAHDPGKIVVSYSGTELVDPACPVGDCNRLRNLPSRPATDTVIPSQESRVMFVDFTVASPQAAPKAVLHHLYAHAATNPGSTAPAPVDYLAAPFDVSAGTPRVIAPPLKGNDWVAVNGCCEPGFPHRSSMAAFNGQLINSQRFAIDWKQLDANGRFYRGDGARNEDYVDYGAGIYAVADGTITSTLDKLDPGTPGALPADDAVLGPQITVQTVDGNNIVEDIGGGTYAFYAHLIKGSLLVKPGDKVRKGQLIAKLGNTGNSSVPHLHFHLMNGPSVLGSDGVPYVIDGFSYTGQVPTQAVLASDDKLSGQFLQGRLPQAQPRTDQLPLSLAVVDFPS